MAKKASARRRIGIRDRLGRLTLSQAKRLLGDDGDARLRRGARFDINLAEDVYLGGDTLRVSLSDPELGRDRKVNVTIVEVTSRPQGLHMQCDCCAAPFCDHIAGSLAMVLEEKLTLGLSAPPDASEPLENLTEQELVQRAWAEREERARSEPMRLESSDRSRPWTDYVVTSRGSGKTYRVSLRGFAAGESYCSCPDFRTNRLGTCKHVLHALDKVRKRFPAAALEAPYRRRNLSLRLDYANDLGLKFNLPTKLEAPLVRILGPARETTITDVTTILPLLRRLERAGYSVHVYPDAEEFIEQRLLRARLSEQAAVIRSNLAHHPLRSTLLREELLPYQLDGIAFAVGAGRAVLADDMGLGKTIQGIGVAELLAQLAGVRRVLVVCPASLKSQWRAEIARFCDRSAQIVMGSAEERVAQYQSDAFFTICNYEQVMRDHPVVEQVAWDLIVLDEGQRIKNWESKTSQVIKSLRSPFALVLSGTPLENRLEELFTVVSFVDDRRLGPAYRFFHQHRVVDDRGKVLGYRNLDQLRENLRPLLLRRTRASVMQELPERTTEIVRIRPTEEQARMSDNYISQAARIAAKKFLTEMDLLRLQKYLLMARMSADSTYLVDKEEPSYSSKLERLQELLEQLRDEGDRKMIVFSEWTTMLNLIEPAFQRLGMRFVRLDGRVPQKKRQQIVHQFQNDPQVSAILMSNAGSTGLNLQAANTVINVDLPWNPAVLEQRIARAHRMGQRRSVQVFLLVTEGTIEERMLGTLSAKHELALAALDVESETSAVQLQSGMEELKRRLEKLLGDQPPAPVDVSQRRAVQAQVESLAAARQRRVAEASGELLGAALNLVGQLVDGGTEPDPQAVAQVAEGLQQCVERDATGRPQLRLTLPDENALQSLAATLARLLIGQGRGEEER